MSGEPAAPIGVLLLQLGTPDAPTAAALRPYLRQFLTDRRVIELSPLVWRPILELFILPLRPRRSAAKYARIWSETTGSPLLHFTRLQAEGVAERLGARFAVRFAMRYGRPAIATALAELARLGCDRLVAVPLYPQYSGPSTGSALDALFAALSRLRVVPALRVVPPFPEDAGYLAALAARHRETLAALAAPPDHTLLTFHGLPRSMVARGDPYPEQCARTAARLAARLGLEPARWSLAFQSRFGPAEWLRPYVDERLGELARGGARRVLVHAPGFTADCLETLDELGYEYGHLFRRAGGEALFLVPCLDDHPLWLDALAALVRREAQGWA